MKGCKFMSIDNAIENLDSQEEHRKHEYLTVRQILDDWVEESGKHTSEIAKLLRLLFQKHGSPQLISPFRRPIPTKDRDNLKWVLGALEETKEIEGQPFEIITVELTPFEPGNKNLMTFKTLEIIVQRDWFHKTLELESIDHPRFWKKRTMGANYSRPAKEIETPVFSDNLPNNESEAEFLSQLPPLPNGSLRTEMNRYKNFINQGSAKRENIRNSVSMLVLFGQHAGHIEAVNHPTVSGNSKDLHDFLSRKFPWCVDRINAQTLRNYIRRDSNKQNEPILKFQRSPNNAFWDSCFPELSRTK
jgi:hypothetical protein